MKKYFLKKIIIYFSVCILVLNTFLGSYFNVNATGLEIPVIVGGGVFGTEACISLVVSLGVALGGGHALNTIANEKGYDNAYDYIYDSLNNFCSDSGRTLAEYSQGLTELLSYTKEGYILLGNDAKDYIKAFVNSFNTPMADVGITSFNGYNFAIIQEGTKFYSFYTNRRLQYWYALQPLLCYKRDYNFYFVSLTTWNSTGVDRGAIRQEDTYDGYISTEYPGNGYPGYPFNSIWQYYGPNDSYPSIPLFDVSSVSDLGNLSSSVRDNIILNLLRTYTPSASGSSIYEDVQPLIEDTTQPLVVNPDVLTNTVGISAVTPSDYAGILSNYYSNIFETPTYIIDNSSVINNYYASNIPASDNVQPFYPIKDEDNYLTHTPNEDLLKKFPFCIPVDISNFIAVFKAEKQAPVFVYGFDVFGEHYEINIDFSMFDTWSIILRDGLSLIYILSLMLLSRKLIRA